MEERSQAVTTATVTIRADVATRTVQVLPPTATLTQQTPELQYKLELVGGTSNSGIRAFIANPDKYKLEPDEETSKESWHDYLFALRDENGNELKPTFIARSGTTGMDLPVVVFFPGESPNMNNPTNSVVIIDW
jgi:hypothetical protein